MNLILSPRDNIGKIELKEVEAYAFEAETLLVVFNDGRCRNYPLRHIWYIEGRIPAGDKRSKPPIQEA